MTDYQEVVMCMGPKRALVVLAMARSGGDVSPAAIVEAQQVSGVHLTALHAKHVNPFITKVFDDDEDISDQNDNKVVSA